MTVTESDSSTHVVNVYSSREQLVFMEYLRAHFLCSDATFCLLIMLKGDWGLENLVLIKDMKLKLPE